MTDFELQQLKREAIQLAIDNADNDSMYSFCRRVEEVVDELVAYREGTLRFDEDDD